MLSSRKIPASARILKSVHDTEKSEHSELRARLEALTAENRALRERMKEESDDLKKERELAQSIKYEYARLQEMETDMLVLVDKYFPVAEED